jgi:glycosyltransferase involved in cell wall biosynthesis
VAVVRNTCHDWSGADEPPAPTGAPARIAFVGYLVESRGAAELLDLCEALPGQAELVVAGTCRSEALIERLKSNPAVSVLGSLPRAQAFGVMRDADLVALLYDPALPVNVLASPNKFFEAMMLGTPVVVSEGIHLSELVRARKLGYVVPYGDAAALRQAVEDVRRPGVRDAFRARCRAHYLAEFQLADDVRRYREFYGQVLRSA